MIAMGGSTARADELIGMDLREWFTAAELADLALPGLPADKRSLNRRAREQNWQMRSSSSGEALARPRSGRGGGIEFHMSLLPGVAQIALAERGIAPAMVAAAPTETTSEGAWRWYEAQSAKVKTEAELRTKIVAMIELLEAAGMTRTAALSDASRQHGIATSTLWNWLKLVEGVAPSDRLPALAPRRQGGGREADIDPALWELFKSDYLRASAPTLAICYAKCCAVAAERGLSVPSEKTFSRKLERDVPRSVILLARKGEEALRRSLPAQQRTVSHFHAMELVNVDGHKFDVFAQRDDGSTFRPILIGIQDVYSRKMLAWRIGDAESAILTRLAFADLFTKFGIPKEVYLDNGRAFASKWITGQMLNRFRFKVKEDEPEGLLTALGVKVHWTLPYRGQSKPIERAWRDLCDSVSKSAAFDGAYTGNSPVNKPENYGKRAVPIDEFIAEVERGIAFHNARMGRRTETARGRSFDAVFEESYVRSPIIRATAEQLRLALLTGENRLIDKQTSTISLFGNRYWSLATHERGGERVTVRFDPDDLTKPIHLYAITGGYLGDAQLHEAVGFDSAASAKEAAKLVADQRKLNKAQLEIHRRYEAADVASQQRVIAGAPAVPEPTVTRLVQTRGRTAVAVKHAPEAPIAEQKHSESRIFAALERKSALKLVE